jgi:DNA-binding transcriptional regulator GbsR (MarR family)
VTDARIRFVEHAAGELAAQGFPPMPARVLMALTASDEGALTSGELQEQLGVSAAAVSGAVRYLQTVGFLRRGTEAGGRRHVYRLPDGSPWYTATLVRGGQMRRIVEVLAEGRESLPPGSPAWVRVSEMSDFFVFLERRMPELLEEWVALRRADGAT